MYIIWCIYIYIYIYIYIIWYDVNILMMFSLFGHIVKKNIKFTHEFNKENITFPDLKMSLSGGQLSTDLHIRSKDKPQYLQYISAHPDYTSIQLYLLERVTGWCKCHGKRCVVSLKVSETSTFTSSVTHET